MISVRKALQCVGVSEDATASVWRDLFGYLENPRVGKKIAPQSVMKQVRLLDKKYFDLDVIQVGVDDFNQSDRLAINLGVESARLAFGVVGLGIRRITHSMISTADAGSFTKIQTHKEYKQLVRQYRGPGPGLDVFVVRMEIPSKNSDDFATGLCKIGFNDKKDKWRVNGCIVTKGKTGTNSFAHEVGHGLGLKHQDDLFNLMTQGSKPLSADTMKLDAKQKHKGIKRTQVYVLFDSDWIRNGCSIEK